MSSPRHRLGAQAEAVVAAALERGGWRVLARRWRVPEGEIDLVCLDPAGVLVAVEVRARRSGRAGGAAESVDRQHLARQRRALARFAGSAPPPHRGLRVDLVAVERGAGGWRAVRYPGVGAW
jgi:putative endonuclease